MSDTVQISHSEAPLESSSVTPAGRRSVTRRLLTRVASRLGLMTAPGRGRATERAEERLREAEAKYRTLVEQLPLVT
jgi:hypothetical protein